MIETAYRISEREDIDYLKDFQEDIPSINQHEVLIKIYAISLNYCDDEIIKVGDKVIRFKKGDRVISNIDPTHLYGPSRSWSYSLDGPVDGMLTQYKALLYTDLIKIPNHLSYEQTASLLRTGTKTWNALLGNNQLLSGQTVLFQGTGSVSLTGLMLVKAAGCTRIIISDDDEKLKQFKDKYGVDYKINKKKEPN
ncbi:unnamed protein product [Rotaria sp. Silwood2]|nr:unnamed protein product [Rotaria sp. Silwood2]